jgi:phenylacetate-CoA ligase
VPFYTRVWDEAGFDPGAVRGPEDIERVPIVTESMVRGAIERGELVARDIDADGCPTFATSGSSGQPLRVPRRALEQRLWRAGSLRIWLEHGYRWRDITAHFDSQPAPSHPLQRLGISRSMWIEPRLPIAEQLAAFRASSADVVVGTPTVLRRMCRAIESAGGGFARPRIVFCQGEALDTGTRVLIERVLGSAPIELYGLTEVGFVAWQCERRDALHVSAETCLAEVRRDGRAARPGELGALVVTDLRGRTQPLIRYDTGDLAEAAASRCPCGRSLPLIGSIEGRARSAVTLPDGRTVTMRAIVEQLSGLLPPDRYRLHQETATRFRLQLDPSAVSDADAPVRRLSRFLGGAEIRLAGGLSPVPGALKSDPVSSSFAPPTGVDGASRAQSRAAPYSRAI